MLYSKFVDYFTLKNLQLLNNEFRDSSYFDFCSTDRCIYESPVIKNNTFYNKSLLMQIIDSVTELEIKKGNFSSTIRVNSNPDLESLPLIFHQGKSFNLSETDFSNITKLISSIGVNLTILNVNLRNLGFSGTERCFLEHRSAISSFKDLIILDDTGAIVSYDNIFLVDNSTIDIQNLKI